MRSNDKNDKYKVSKQQKIKYKDQNKKNDKHKGLIWSFKP